jgi:hypothetical protein
MYYLKSAGDDRFVKNMERGCQYWNDNFFWRRDNQRCSQSIGTLVFLRDRDPENLSLALKVARWPIEDTPTLH